ncbi:hypothetical protein H5410_054864, partial [Solanum commersonii]
TCYDSGYTTFCFEAQLFADRHNARGKHPYASIMMEFYHCQLTHESAQLPRIFGMTASPIKSKGIPFSNPKLKIYKHVDISSTLSKSLSHDMARLKEKHECSISKSNLSYKSDGFAKRPVSKLYSAFLFCLSEMGVWLAFKAAEFLSQEETDFFSWGELDVCAQTIVRDFSLDASKVFSGCLPSGITVSNIHFIHVFDFFMLSGSLTHSLSLRGKHRDLEDLRCIIFVERIITTIVLRSLLNDLLPELSGWRNEYTAGHVSVVQSHIRYISMQMLQVNIIAATSILEEGLDVQSCNLVIRFDPLATVCSYIQSRERARMQNSDFLLMVKSGDESTLTRVQNFMASGEMMRQESLHHASIPCSPLEDEMLPSDGYFKPNPRCVIDKETRTCTLQLPKSCPLQRIITVQGNSTKILRQLACLKACKELHRVGTLTDNLIPTIIDEETINKELELQHETYDDIQLHGIILVVRTRLKCDELHGIILAVRTRLKCDDEILAFDLDVGNRGRVQVQLKYSKVVTLSSEEIRRYQRFQDALVAGQSPIGFAVFDYLLLLSVGTLPEIKSKCVNSLLFPSQVLRDKHMDWCSTQDRKRSVNTKTEVVCSCLLENSLVFTPHNGNIYCITGFLNNLDCNSLLIMRTGESITYREYYKKWQGIKLCFEEPLLRGKCISKVHNYLQRSKTQKAKDAIDSSVELPPEICLVIMSPVSISTLYMYSFVPSIMHRIESLVMASHLNSMLLDDYKLNVFIPTAKVLQAVTTRKSLEKFHLESLETFGDAFVKYVVSTQLFKTYENHHEGFLCVKKSKIISNDALCKLGCARKIPIGIYLSKRVVDVVEALIGAYLSSGGEVAVLSLMKWLRMDIDFVDAPIQRNFPLNAEKLVNIRYFESLLHYKFHDPSLLVEAQILHAT